MSWIPEKAVCCLFPLCYAVAISASPMIIDNQMLAVNQLDDKQVTIAGKSELHLTHATAPLLNGSTINFNSDDGWVFFDNIRPETVNAQFLGQLQAFGAAPVLGTNMKLVQYINGTVVIPRGKSYRPLFVFDEKDLKGIRDTIGEGLWSNTAIKLNDKVSSFILKRGYIASFAQNADGTGNSAVFIADKGDLRFNFNADLDNAVSLIRVSEFRWSGKKGIGGGTAAQRTSLNISTWYDWGDASTSTLNMEYIPMSWGAASATEVAKIGARTDFAQLLTFNESDNPTGQSGQYNNLSNVDTCVKRYSQLLATGLRMGSPAVTDDATGWTYLDQFMKKTKAQNLRVDFLALHIYQKWTAAQLYNKIKSLYTAYGKPIWLTEFNFAALWTALPGNQQQYYAGIKEYIDMLDTCSFVEHYYVYSWWGTSDTVLSFFKTDASTTPTVAGTWFSGKQDVYGYNPALLNLDGQEISVGVTDKKPVTGRTIQEHRARWLNGTVRFQGVAGQSARLLNSQGRVVAAGPVSCMYIASEFRTQTLPAGVYTLYQGNRSWQVLVAK